VPARPFDVDRDRHRVVRDAIALLVLESEDSSPGVAAARWPKSPVTRATAIASHLTAPGS
jgi:hypothetical protein